MLVRLFLCLQLQEETSDQRPLTLKHQVNHDGLQTHCFSPGCSGHGLILDPLLHVFLRFLSDFKKLADL